MSQFELILIYLTLGCDAAHQLILSLKQAILPTFQVPLSHLSSGWLPLRNRWVEPLCSQPQLCACDDHHADPRVEKTVRNKAFRAI